MVAVRSPDVAMPLEEMEAITVDPGIRMWITVGEPEILA